MTLRNQHTYLWGSTLQPLKKNWGYEQTKIRTHIKKIGRWTYGSTIFPLWSLFASYPNIILYSIHFYSIPHYCWLLLIYITMISRIAPNDVSDYYKHPTICHINTMPGLPLMSRLFPIISTSYYNMLILCSLKPPWISIKPFPLHPHTVYKWFVKTSIVIHPSYVTIIWIIYPNSWLSLVTVSLCNSSQRNRYPLVMSK
jgi:hypothetical protein